MVVAMAVYDQTPGAARPRTEGGDGLGLPPPVVPCEAPDWRLLYEQQRVRADALQARVKELTWAETSARSHAGMLKWNLARTRAQLEAAHGEVKEVRRDAQQSLFFKSQVARLEALLEEAGVETSRRSTMMSLRQEVFRLKKDLKAATAWHREVASLKRATVRQGETIKELRARCAEQEADLARLRGTRATLSKAAFGSKSEKQKKEGTGKKRGQQRGASGHGRTPRPSLPENEERHDPPASERVCPCCGEPYVANGEHVSSVHEIEVKAHTRKIVRGRWRRGCQCPSSPQEVTAPPALRLFPRTPYGISVWERVLYERYACFRPLRRVSRWMAEQGLPMAPGTMAGAMKSLAPMFAPLASAILDHHNDMTVRHGDETGWRIQSLKTSGRSQRAWMWNSVSADSVFFHIDPSRSAAVAKKLFGSTRVTVFLVCDRYSAYKKLARELAGKVILCLCWTHARRDVIEAAAGQEGLEDWSDRWLARIAVIFQVNTVRLMHYDPALERQTSMFDALQDALAAAVEALFRQAQTERDALPEGAREAKVLRSLIRHREGLSVFVDHPQIPMDNSEAERRFRDPVIGRRLSFGSDSEGGAAFTAIMYSLIGTLAMNGICVRRWLHEWLEACARNGGKAPDDLDPWLPWSMSPERRRDLMEPG